MDLAGLPYLAAETTGSRSEIGSGSVSPCAVEQDLQDRQALCAPQTLENESVGQSRSSSSYVREIGRSVGYSVPSTGTRTMSLPSGNRRQIDASPNEARFGR